MIQRFKSLAHPFDKEYDPESSLSHDLTYLFEARSVAGKACTSGASLETMKGRKMSTASWCVVGTYRYVPNYQTRSLKTKKHFLWR